MLIRYLTLCFLLLSFARSVAQDEQPISSAINDVTVYRKGAQIRRSALVRIDPGRATLVFTGLPTRVVERSIQVAAPDSEVIILGVRHRLHHTEGNQSGVTADSFKLAREQLLQQERRLKTRLAIGQEEEAVLAANRDLGGSDSGLDAAELERGVRYHRERITDIRMERLLLTDSLQIIADRQQALAERFSESTLDSLPETTGEVVVEIESASTSRDSMHLTYIVADAGWEPVYHLRMTDTDSPLALSSGARVSQKSGEDWETVRLTLSTGNPGRSTRLPNLIPWNLAPYQKPPSYTTTDPGFELTEVRAVSGRVTDEVGNALVGVTVSVNGTSLGTVTDLDGSYSISLPQGSMKLTFSYIGYENQHRSVSGPTLDVQLFPDAQTLDEVVVVGYGGPQRLAGAAPGVHSKRQASASVPLPVTIDRRPTTVNFAIDLPYTIPSGESSRLVKIQDFSVPAEYRHTAVPKVDERVFLSAIVRDWERLDLIDGEIQLFVAGTFLGATQLDVSQTADSLVFSLGPDPGVVICRSPSERYSREAGLFGGKRTVWRGWELSARNTKTVPVHLTVIDQVPLAAQGGIDVEVELPDNVEYDQDSGELKWDFILVPSSGWESEFGYRVRYSTSGPLYLE